MAKKTEAAAAETTVLARAPNDASEALLAQLAADGVDLGTDGLAEVSPSDLRTAMRLFNLKGKVAADGSKVRQDMFFDTVDKTTKTKINCALLELHKSNQFTVYDQSEQRNRRICSSFDQHKGTVDETGVVRPCKGCPDARWIRGDDGKPKARCSEVWDVFAYDLDEQKIFVIRFKRTSLEAIRSYVAQHHIGKRRLPNGKAGNYPFFLYRVEIALEMVEKDTHAVPVITKGAEFAIDELKVLIETSAAVRDSLAERLADAETRTDEGDASFDVDAMGEANAAAFVPE